MNWSLNEAEALAKKAARGAGMDWGLAEETGRATRVLLSLGISAAGPLAELLEAHDGADPEEVAPQGTSGPWCASGGVLCPIATGACLNDHAQLLANGAIRMGAVAHPVFLIPFAQAAAGWLGQPVTLAWPGAALAIDATRVTVLDGTALLAARADAVTCTSGAPSQATPLPTARRADIAPEIAARLTAFANRTYAPATEASRIAGAGAGLSDND